MFRVSVFIVLIVETISRATVEQTLNSGTHIVCDRYAFSGIAFTASKPSQIPFEWCRTPDISLPAPDLILYLDISPNKAKERGGYGEERYEQEEMQTRVREVYRRMREETMAVGSNRESENRPQWVEIDAGRSVEDVGKEIWIHVEPFVQPSGISKPIGRLWMDRLPSAGVTL